MLALRMYVESSTLLFRSLKQPKANFILLWNKYEKHSVLVINYLAQSSCKAACFFTSKLISDVLSVWSVLKITGFFSKHHCHLRFIILDVILFLFFKLMNLLWINWLWSVLIHFHPVCLFQVTQFYWKSIVVIYSPISICNFLFVYLHMVRILF